MVSELTIQHEPWSIMRSEIEPLWEELARGAEQGESGPRPVGDVQFYDAFGDELVCIAWRAEGALVGFWLGFVMSHPHYRGAKALLGDLVYVRPAHRGPSIGRALRLLINEGKRRGASVAYINSPIGRDFGPLLQRFGFRPTEVQYRAWI